MTAADLEPRRFSILHLSTAHTSSDNRIYRKECTSLHEAGVNVAFMSRGPAPDGQVPWVELPATTSRLGRMLRGPLAAWRRLRILQPDVLHIHDPELIPLGVLWRKRTGGRVVYDAHEDLPKQVAGKPYLPRWSRGIVVLFARALEATAERNFDAIVAATPSIARNFTRAARVELVQNFPWLRDYPDPTPVSEVAPATACYVGALTRERGSRQMCEAVAAASGGFHLTFAGRATPEAQADLTALREQLTDLGQLGAEQVPDVVKSSAVGLVLFQDLPNHVEAQPTKLFEYMAAGRPFVASDFPYWRALLGEHDCGIFVDPSSPQAIRDALDSLAKDPETMAALGGRGRIALEQHFTFEAQAARLTQLARDLLATP